MKSKSCLFYSIIIGFLIVNIIMMMYDLSVSDSKNSEQYCHPFEVDLSMKNEPSQVMGDMIYQPVQSFGEKRQCNFNLNEDIGQYSYAGCACARVGEKTDKVMMDDSILYKGFN